MVRPRLWLMLAAGLGGVGVLMSSLSLGELRRTEEETRQNLNVAKNEPRPSLVVQTEQCAKCLACRLSGKSNTCTPTVSECVATWRRRCAEDNHTAFDLRTHGCTLSPPCPDPKADVPPAAMVVLYYNDSRRWAMLESICTNIAAAHPLFLFQLSTEEASAEDKNRVHTIFTSPSCLHKDRDLRWEVVPDAVWFVGEDLVKRSDQGQKFVRQSGGLSYRRMIWFWHHQLFFALPSLRPYRYLVRLDTDSRIGSTPLVDPVEHLHRVGGVYGYASFCYDPPFVTRGLHAFFKKYAEEHSTAATNKTLLSLFPSFNMHRSCFDDVKHSCQHPFPMFYNNFEAVDSEWFRQEHVKAFLLAAYEGIFMRRWGDAPLRAALLALYAPEKVVHLNTFHYEHGRRVVGVHPLGNTFWTRWDAWAGRFPWKGNDYYGGFCYAQPPPPRTCILPAEEGAPPPSTYRAVKEKRKNDFVVRTITGSTPGPAPCPDVVYRKSRWSHWNRPG